MTALVIVEIVICVLLALGIAIAALLSFIKGRDHRPSLLIGSSSAAVALLIGCMVCTALQINRNRTEVAAAEFEELSQVRVESVGREEKSSSKAVSGKTSETKTEEAIESQTEPESTDIEKNRAELLASYFGSSTEKETTVEDVLARKAAEVKSDELKIYYDISPAPKYDDTYWDDSEDDLYYDYFSDDTYRSAEEENTYVLDLDAFFGAGSVDWNEDSGNQDESFTDFGWDYSEPDYRDDYYDPEPEYNEPETEYYTDPEPDYTEPEPEYTEPEYYEPEPEYNEPETEEVYVWDGSVLTNMSGVNWGPTGKETYYNMDMSGVVGVMRGMGFSEEEYPYYVREDGCKMLGPYIMVAANLDHFPRGSVVECSLGAALVCDTGGFAYSGVGWSQLDIATSW